MPWPSGELKHTLLACVPVGPALWGVEVVSEWRVDGMGKGVVKCALRDKDGEGKNEQRQLN